MHPVLDKMEVITQPYSSRRVHTYMIHQNHLPEAIHPALIACFKPAKSGSSKFWRFVLLPLL